MNAAQDIGVAPVMAYMRHYMESAPPIPESVMEGVSFVDGFALIVLDRQGQFQAQLTLCAPGAESGDHSHPNVDSIVYYVTGEVYFRIDLNGQMVPVYKPGDVHEIGDELQRCSHHGKWLRVLPGQMHGATIGPNGGAFISFQHWLDGKPASVDQDWEGSPLGKQHAKRLDVEFKPAPKFEPKVKCCRELRVDEVHLCIEGGKSFFDEGKMPGGFDAEYFVRKWQTLIAEDRGVIIGSFDGDTITGAIGAVVGPGMFSPAKFAIEGFWYVLPEYRTGRYGINLLKSFELWGDVHGVDYYSMIHLTQLQPERLGELYERLGYEKIESHYVKAAKV